MKMGQVLQFRQPRTMGAAANSTQSDLQQAGQAAMVVGSFFGPLGTLAGAAFEVLTNVLNAIGIGPNPKNVPDTQMTEAAMIAYHQLWYQLTGEDLGGVPGGICTCQPGDCGKQGCPIFNTPTKYPNVPGGAAGYAGVDAQQVYNNGLQIYQAGRAKLLQSSSYKGYDFNWNYMQGLFQQVISAQRAQGGPGGSVSSVLSSVGGGSTLPWIAAAVLLWAIL